MSKFNVGDRVRAYGQNMKGWFDVINDEGDNGTVTRVEEGFIEVRMDNDYGDGRLCGFHPKQLRKLVKKERRRVWVSIGSLARSGDTMPVFYSYTPACIEFREVLRKPTQGGGV